ncbi:MAG: hypothetical protein C4524_07725 [Candidatus Zixiibacteriota bacterium]|nr:MAG: hypothetical protein C4524_07725 [candidate division Zixibacteria bacterium]
MNLMTAKRWNLMLPVVFAALLLCRPLPAFERPGNLPQPSGTDKVPPQALRVEGTDIVNAKGETVLLRGPNFGGWLYWEGGVLEFPNVSEHIVRREWTAQMGAELVDRFFQGITENLIQEDDFRRVKDMGYNTVCIPFHHRYVQAGTETLLDQAIRWAGENELYLLLNMQCAPGGQNPDYQSDSDGEARLWTSDEYRRQYLQAWEILATRYRDNPWLIYEVLNEPVPTSTDRLLRLYREVIAVIRQAEAGGLTHVIALDGYTYSTEFQDFDRETVRGNIALCPHFFQYSIPNIEAYLDRIKNVRDRLKVPLIMGSFDDTETIPYLEQAGIGWCVWNYKSVNELPPFYSMPEDHPWRRYWWNNVTAQVRRSPDLLERVTRLIQNSGLSTDLKDELMQSLRSSRRMDKTALLGLAERYPEHKRELGRVWSETIKTLELTKQDLLTEALKNLSDEQLDRLLKSLQTRYFRISP